MTNSRIYTQIKTTSGPLQSDGSIFINDASTALYLDASNNLSFKDRLSGSGVSLRTLHTGYLPYVDGSLGRRDSSINSLIVSKANLTYVDGSLAKIDSSVSNLFAKNDQLLLYAGNGVISGCNLSVNVFNNTQINISPGAYVIIDNSSYTNPKYNRISFPGVTEVPITNFTANATYIALDVNQNVVQKSSPYTQSERRNLCILGVAVHSNHTNINVVNATPDVAIGTHCQLMGFFDVFGTINKSGNVISANGANLRINKSAGTIFKRGVGYSTNGNFNEIDLGSLVGPSNIRYRRSDGTEYSDRDTVDLYYQTDSSTIAPIPSNRYSIQRIVLFQSNLLRIQYGPQIYSTMELAAAAISSETFTLESNMAENGIVRCFLIVRGGITNLSNPLDARFVEADMFGQRSLGSVGGGSSTLQQAYDNSSVPQITTDSTRHALEIKIGSGSNADNALKVLDSSGNTNASISGEGLISSKILSVSRTNASGIQIDGSYGWRLAAMRYCPKSGGATDPSLSAFRGGNVSSYSFSAGDSVDAISIVIPNDYKSLTDIHVNLHWSHNSTAISGNMVNTWYFTYAKGSQQAIFPSEITVTQTISTDISTYARWQNNTASFQLTNAGGDASHIDRALIEPGGVIMAKLVSTSIPSLSGGSPNEPFFISTSISYQTNSVGTRNRVPNYYS